MHPFGVLQTCTLAGGGLNAGGGVAGVDQLPDMVVQTMLVFAPQIWSNEAVAIQ